MKKELIKLKKFITLDKWCKGWFAEDKNGRPTESLDPKACKWCLSGAINLLFDSDKIKKNIIRDILNDTAIELYNSKTINEINDELGFKALQNLLDNAIKNTK